MISPKESWFQASLQTRLTISIDIEAWMCHHLTVRSLIGRELVVHARSPDAKPLPRR